MTNSFSVLQGPHPSRFQQLGKFQFLHQHLTTKTQWSNRNCLAGTKIWSGNICCSWITLCFLSFSNFLLLLYINIFLRNRCSCLLSFGITSLLKLIGEHTSNRMLSRLAAFTSEKESVTPQLRQSRPLNSPRLSFPLSPQSHFAAALIYW